MTFCVTCVVERIVVTHFRNPSDGTASDTRGVVGYGASLESSKCFNTDDDSNQNKQVIYTRVILLVTDSKGRQASGQCHLSSEVGQAALAVINGGRDLKMVDDGSARRTPSPMAFVLHGGM